MWAPLTSPPHPTLPQPDPTPPPKVVAIVDFKSTSSGAEALEPLGSGVIFTGLGHVVTNYHVVGKYVLDRSGAQGLKVVLQRPDGSSEALPAAILGGLLPAAILGGGGRGAALHAAPAERSERRAKYTRGACALASPVAGPGGRKPGAGGGAPRASRPRLNRKAPRLCAPLPGTDAMRDLAVLGVQGDLPADAKPLPLGASKGLKVWASGARGRRRRFRQRRGDECRKTRCPRRTCARALGLSRFGAAAAPFAL
jgi:hypothetical protein